MSSEEGMIYNRLRLMPAINRDGHFLSTEAVKENCLTKLINRGGHFKMSVLVNVC